jgi:hypothetical protein
MRSTTSNGRCNATQVSQQVVDVMCAPDHPHQGFGFVVCCDVEPWLQLVHLRVEEQDV